MPTKRCGNGHAYDDAKYTNCPYCGIEDFDPGITKAKGDAPDKTKQKSPDELPGQYDSAEDEARTQPRRQEGPPDQPESDGDQRTVGLMFKEKGVDPVVGWLVCVEGPEKGRDFRLRSGRNTVGRSRKMNVCIAGDDSISRENHAAVAYDQKANEFTLIPGEGRELVYLNGEAVHQPSTIESHDEIELGETSLRFVPFCGESFEW